MHYLSMTKFILCQVPAIPFDFQNPDVWVALVIVAALPMSIYFFVRWLRSGSNKKLEVFLDKDRLYMPRTIYLSVKNTGIEPIDINNPVVVFSYYFIRRKLKLKGSEGRNYYPLYLDPGMSHELSIDMNCFFQYDPSLKKYFRLTVYITELNGKVSGSKSIMVRKSLFR
jgi:hypothetical protein